MKRLWKDELDEVKEKVLRHFWEEKEKIQKRERLGRYRKGERTND